MSIINDEDILQNYIISIKDQIGSELSTLTNNLGDPMPAVIQDIQNGVRPDFPYITVSVLYNNEKQGAWQRTSYVDDQDRIHHVAEEEITLKVTCYGDSATSILKKLRMHALDDSVRSSMNTLTGATFIDYSGINRQPVFLSTDFVNAASIISTFTAISDLVIDDGGGIIEDVTGEASYLRIDGDETPISVPIDTTSS